MEAASAVAPRAAAQHLTELNPRSAAIGAWEVAVFNAKIEHWTSKTGQQGGVFRCMLVCVKDLTSYVEAKVLTRGADAKRLKTALKKYV